MYLDTSVLVPVYCPEAISARAETAVRAERHTVSDLTEVEFVAAVRHRARRGEIDATEIDSILDLFQEHLAAGYYQRVPLASGHLREAQALLRAASVRLGALDALHLSLARATGLEVLTADTEMARAAGACEVRVTLLQPD